MRRKPTQLTDAQLRESLLRDLRSMEAKLALAKRLLRVAKSTCEHVLAERQGRSIASPKDVTESLESFLSALKVSEIQ